MSTHNGASHERKRFLTLPEQLFLLSLDEEMGSFRCGHLARYGLPAAVLSELLLRERLVIENDRVKVRNMAPVGDEVLDLALDVITVTPLSHRLTWWLRNLYQGRPSPKRLLIADLMMKGDLGIVGKRFVWIQPRTPKPPTLHSEERAFVRRLRRSLLTDEAMDERLCLLLAILAACRELGLVVSRGERKKRKDRIESVCESDPVAFALGSAIADIMSADDALSSAPVLR